MGRIRAPIFKPNWSHPLNRGRVAWWLCQPNKLGGGTWFDLCANNHGTLTSMGGASGATNGFRSTTRPGGWGGVLFDGSAGYVSTPILNLNYASGTIAWWQKSSVASNSGTRRYSWSQMTGTNELSCQIFTDNNWYVGWWSSGSPANRVVLAATSTNNPLNVWARYAYVWSPSQSLFYMNGAQLGVTVAAPPVVNVASNFVVGKSLVNGSALFTGQEDDVAIYSRAISPAEVQLDYTLSRQRYPGVLQSMPLRTYSVPPAGPVGNGLLMRRRRFLLGAA